MPAARSTLARRSASTASSARRITTTSAPGCEKPCSRSSTSESWHPNVREHDALRSYPRSSGRGVISRTIKNRLAALPRDREFFDGARENGYGGFVDDGRWGPV